MEFGIARRFRSIFKNYRWLIWGGVVLLSACRSPQISRHFRGNRYLPLFANVVYNDSLSLFFPSFGDVVYQRDVKQLRRVLRSRPLTPGDSVVLWGSTSAPPYYAFALTVNETGKPNETGRKHGIFSMKESIFDRDTCVNGRWFRLLGFVDNADSHIHAERDFQNIWHRIKLDSLNGNRFGSPFAITDLKTNKLYAVLDNLQQFPVYSNQERWSKTQLIITYASFLGDNETYRRGLAALETRMNIDSAVLRQLASEPDVLGDDALSAIVSEARNRKLVMVNENHFYPAHRLLVYDLLDSLRVAGFQYLALEALDPQQEDAVNRTHHIDLNTGFYTQEQQYGRLLRKALALGFTLVGYENTDPTIDREVGQATNLYEKTFGKDAAAKVLVLAGMDHILEMPVANDRKWMAAHFKTQYGIDPLTIDQNDFKGLRGLAPDTYRLVSSDHFSGDRLRAVDYHVINGRSVAALDTVGVHECIVYRNKRRDSVQVSLFLTDKPLNVALATEVPYFTTLVPAKSKTRIPTVKGKPVLVVAYDRQGNRISP